MTPGHWTESTHQDHRLPHGLTSWREPALLVEYECPMAPHLFPPISLLSLRKELFPSSRRTLDFIRVAPRLILNDGILVLLESVGRSFCHSFPVRKILLLIYYFDRTFLSLIPRLWGIIDIVARQGSAETLLLSITEKTEGSVDEKSKSYSTYRTNEIEYYVQYV